MKDRNNLNSKIVNQFKEDTIRSSLSDSDVTRYILDKKLNQFDKKMDKTLSDNGIKDEKIKLLLEESHKSDGRYKESVDKLLKNYLNESKLTKEQLKSINNVMKDSDKLKKQKIVQTDTEKQIARKKENIENPLSAFSHAMEDIKKTKSLSTGIGTAFKGIKNSLTPMNIMKGMLHTAGIAMDNPAINIITSMMDSRVEEEENLNVKQLEFADKLLAKEGNNSKAEQEFGQKVSKNRNIIQEVKANPITQDSTPEDVVQTVNKIDNLERLDDIYQDHGKLLEDIKEALVEANRLTNKQIFMTQDALDDNKSSSVSATKPTDEIGMETEKDDTSIISDLMGMGGNGKKGLLAGMGKKLLKFAGIAGVLYGVYEGISGAVKGMDDVGKTFNLSEGQIATSMQTFSSGLGGLVESLSFGLLDAKDIATGFVDMTTDMSNSFKKIFSNAKVIDTVDTLEKKGVVDTSIFGKSEIRDWKAIEALPYESLRAVYDYADWSTEDEIKIRNIMNAKKPPVIAVPPVTNNTQNQNPVVQTSTTTPTVQSNTFDMNKTLASEVKVSPKVEAIPEKVVDIKETNTTAIEKMDIPEVKKKDNVVTPSTNNSQSMPIITGGNKETTKKLSDYKLDDGNLIQLFTLTGLRL
jgi:hypothetical protein